MRRYLALGLGLCFASAASGQTVTTIANGIEASGDLSIGADGNVYVADFGSSLATAGGANIYRIAPDGSATDVFNGEFGGASGNEFGQDGILYQSDVGRGEVHRVAPDGTRTQIASGLSSPVGVTPGPDGAVYVTECSANAITRINADGAKERIAEGAPLNCPNGLSLGGDGHLYAANFSDGEIVRIALPDGALSVAHSVPGGGNGHLSWANDRFYVASFRGNRIYSVTAEGQFCHIAGIGDPGNADGPALAATFFRPNGMAVTANGDTLFTNTNETIVGRGNPGLHPNAVRRVDGLLDLLDCPEDRVVGTRTADEAQLREIKTQTWPDFYRNQDVEGLSAYLAPGFVNISPDGTVTTREEEIAGVAAEAWNPTNFRYLVDRIDWFGPDLALVIGRGLSDRTDDGGQPCSHSYASTNLIRRTPTSPTGWRALASHVSGLTCAASAN